MPSCALRYCTNHSRKLNKSQGVTFHRFPRPGYELREAWIKYIQRNRSEETWLPSVHTHICSVHFKNGDKYTTNTGRIYLKKSAMPCDNVSSQKLHPCSGAEGCTAPASSHERTALENNSSEDDCEVITISSSGSGSDDVPSGHDEIASRERCHNKSMGVQCRNCTGTSDECECSDEAPSVKDTQTSHKKYVCKQCKFRTNKQYILIKHLYLHTDKKVYKCEHCQYTTSQTVYLGLHMRKHTGEKPYNCEECEYRTTQKSALTKHARTHTGKKPHKCQQCEYSAADISNLKRHMFSHTKLNI